MIKKILLLSCILFTATIIAQQNNCADIKSHSITNYYKTNNGGIAETLMNKYDVKFHHLNLNVERTSTYISGWVRTVVSLTSSLDTFAFELYAGLSIDSVFSGAQKVTVTNVGNFGYAVFPTTLGTGSIADMKIYYHGTPPTPGSGALGAGFSNGTDGPSGIQATWSLSEPYSAFEWFPCKQSLRDKIDSVYVFVTTDSANRVGSNGLLKNTVTLGNKKRYEWKQIYPIDYYLISLAVSKYYDYSFYAYPVNTPPILIQNYIYNNPSTIANMKPQFDKTKKIMELFCTLFGPYAFAAEKYGHSMAPIGGGMEHQTMTTIGVINFSIIAHELGHQWFGDAVTCGTWKDIWVNESFATYTSYLAYQYLDSANAMAYIVGSHNTVMGSPGGSIWFTDTTNVGRIFDNRLTYQKGCSMIHMIRFELNNDTIFFNVLKEYIRRFKAGTAVTGDFKKVLEEISGRDFTVFFNQWFYGEGYPIINLFWNQTGTTLQLVTGQSTSFPSSVSLFVTPIEYKIKTTKGDTTIRTYIHQNMQGLNFYMKDTVLSVQVDPSNWLLSKNYVIHDVNLTPLGVSKNADTESNIILFPNPSRDFITVQLQEASQNVKYFISDVSGRSFLNGILTGQSTTLDIQSLPKGFYVIHFENNSHNYKLFKQ